MTLVELQSLTKRLGMPGFAAKQITSWLYEKKVASIDDMTNLSLKHRELLKQNYEVGAGADTSGRVAWAKQLTNKEAMKYTPQNIFKESSNWYPYK